MNRLLDTCRAISLVLALVALAVGAIWILLPDWVNQLDTALVRSYVSSAKTRLERARSAAGTDTARAFAEYAAFLNGLQPIRKGDRLAALKRQAFEELVRSLVDLKRYPEALRWVERWVAFDPNDLLAQTQRIGILARNPERLAEALRLAGQLFLRLPEVALVADVYARLLWESGQPGAAVLAYDKHLRLEAARQVDRWGVFWNTGSGFSGRQTTLVEPLAGPETGLRIDLELPSGVREVRVDPPPGMRLWIADPHLRRPESGGADLRLGALSLGLHQMQLQGSLLVTVPEANDPYFFWSMPDGPNAPAGRLALLFDVGPDLPGWFLSLARGESARRFRAALEQGGEADALEAWDRMSAISELRRRWEAPPPQLPQTSSGFGPRASGSVG